MNGVMPASVYAEQDEQELPARMYMRRAYVNHCQKRGLTHLSAMYLGQALYDAYVAELSPFERSIVEDERGRIRFKGAVVAPEGRGWRVRRVEPN